jgi:hypothetical protein
MKNLDILVLTGVVIFCFITFFISTFRVFDSISKQEVGKVEQKGIISRLLAYFESLK